MPLAMEITGLLLAGGRGSRMGGLDKGLQPLAGRPLVEHVLERLRPQVGPLLISANRHLEHYARYGCPVLPDGDDQFAGPLAGLLAGLRHCESDWLLCVPCDAPRLPLDLAERLSAALRRHSGALLALPVLGDGGSVQPGQAGLQPTFCLLHRSLGPSLADYLAAGGRQMQRWQLAQCHVLQPFDRAGDPAAFFNANHLEDLHMLEDHG